MRVNPPRWWSLTRYWTPLPAACRSISIIRGVGDPNTSMPVVASSVSFTYGLHVELERVGVWMNLNYGDLGSLLVRVFVERQNVRFDSFDELHQARNPGSLRVELARLQPVCRNEDERGCHVFLTSASHCVDRATHSGT